MIALNACRPLQVRPEQLAQLVTEPSVWVAFEPRLKAAHWLSGGVVEAGSLLQFQTVTSHQNPLAEALIGQPAGVVELLAWVPPLYAEVVVRTRLAVVHARIKVTPDPVGSLMRIDGTAAPHSSFANALLAPLAPLLERRATTSIEQALGRIEVALRSR